MSTQDRPQFIIIGGMENIRFYCFVLCDIIFITSRIVLLRLFIFCTARLKRSFVIFLLHNSVCLVARFARYKVRFSNTRFCRYGKYIKKKKKTFQSLFKKREKPKEYYINII